MSCRKCHKNIVQDSFVLLKVSGNSVSKSHHPHASFSSRVERQGKLRTFIQTGQLPPTEDDSDSSSPLEDEFCLDCLRALSRELDTQLREAKADEARYTTLLARASTFDTDDLFAKLAELSTAEGQLESFLEKVKSQKAKVQEDIELARQDERAVQDDQDRFWAKFTRYVSQRDMLRDMHAVLQSKIDYGKQCLHELDLHNVYQDTFYISAAGKSSVATINGFRLGRLPDAQVPWEEINAAWGQAVLLLYIMAKKTTFSFTMYRLRPMGNRSTVETKSGDLVLNLHGCDDLGFGSWLSSWPFAHKQPAAAAASTFDDAMVAFLSCLGEMSSYARQHSPQLDMPYV
eukprot:TRINITY_DN2679_c0_g1_i3.p1 TRINITY_DN2679_c0_g1~~TRINITY_DN2679_c0_g1_i3.p1  ORF type:complete len:345 (+),score=53.17 TRINITY_DN2679_c0_g1_i3:94-1128(+)